MHIDLVNWLEILAATIAVFCCLARPTLAIAVLALLLLIVVGVEFTAKYLNQRYIDTQDAGYASAKVTMYSLFNIAKFCGYLGVLYLMIKDSKPELYLTGSALIILFVTVNLFAGQGPKAYNNYSNAFGIVVMVGLALHTLRRFDGAGMCVRQRTAVLIYLFTIIIYSSATLPLFLFFHQMFAKNVSSAIQMYRMIVDSANLFFYTCLALVALLWTYGQVTGNDTLRAIKAT